MKNHLVVFLKSYLTYKVIKWDGGNKIEVNKKSLQSELSYQFIKGTRLSTITNGIKRSADFYIENTFYWKCCLYIIIYFIKTSNFRYWYFSPKIYM